MFLWLRITLFSCGHSINLFVWDYLFTLVLWTLPIAHSVCIATPTNIKILYYKKLQLFELNVCVCKGLMFEPVEPKFGVLCDMLDLCYFCPLKEVVYCFANLGPRRISSILISLFVAIYYVNLST